jgi:hypothetical protein
MAQELGVPSLGGKGFSAGRTGRELLERPELLA